MPISLSMLDISCRVLFKLCGVIFMEAVILIIFEFTLTALRISSLFLNWVLLIMIDSPIFTLWSVWIRETVSSQIGDDFDGSFSCLNICNFFLFRGPYIFRCYFSIRFYSSLILHSFSFFSFFFGWFHCFLGYWLFSLLLSFYCLFSVLFFPSFPSIFFK